ncbi:hypothetical protein PRZ48_006107 [Zasmidium cellare]|uniref:Uncharacterized protein n=1 Tax=Zasmidium cellare TaxID=395010 RepID=A0ABR0EM73_ZASCE|nr:hypothetical protein PRZ48_006107 [Zasmidium cellare]
MDAASSDKISTAMQDPTNVKKQAATKPIDPPQIFPSHILSMFYILTSLISLSTGLIIGIEHDDLAETFLDIALVSVAALVIYLLDHYTHLQPAYQQATGHEKRARQLFRFAPYLCCLATLPFDPKFGSSFVNFTIYKLILQLIGPWCDIHAEIAPEEVDLEMDRTMWALGVLVAYGAYESLGKKFVEEAIRAAGEKAGAWFLSAAGTGHWW